MKRFRVTAFETAPETTPLSPLYFCCPSSSCPVRASTHVVHHGREKRLERGAHPVAPASEHSAYGARARTP